MRIFIVLLISFCSLSASSSEVVDEGTFAVVCTDFGNTSLGERLTYVINQIRYEKKLVLMNVSAPAIISHIFPENIVGTNQPTGRSELHTKGCVTIKFKERK